MAKDILINLNTDVHFYKISPSITNWAASFIYLTVKIDWEHILIYGNNLGNSDEWANGKLGMI